MWFALFQNNEHLISEEIIKFDRSMHFSENLYPGLLLQYFKSDSLNFYIRKDINIFRLQINSTSLTYVT
jgi:hypothetical protein